MLHANLNPKYITATRVLKLQGHDICDTLRVRVNLNERHTPRQQSVVFTIDTEVLPSDIPDLLTFIHQYYVIPHPEALRFSSKETIDHQQVLSFRAFDPEKLWWVDISIRGQKPILVEMQPSDFIVPQETLNNLKEEIEFSVKLYEDKVRKTTLYFAWVEGKETIPETMPSIKRRTIEKLFRSNMIVMYVISIALSIIIFSVLGRFAPIFIIGFQFVTVLLADRIVLRLGNWRVDSANPYVHMLRYELPTDLHNEFHRKYGRHLIDQMKREIYEKSFAVGREPTCEVAKEVFEKYGFKCDPERMSGKKVNVYSIVKNAADKFGIPIPKVTISNMMVPNAAATGPSPNHGTVLITTGLLVQLEDDEVLSVVGHEMGHLKGHDPLWLFGLMSLVYMILLLSPPFLFSSFMYFIVGMGVVYFIAKFFEARADLYSAVVIGQPHVLAESLRKIGYRRLQLEKIPQLRIQAWLSWDPHPPISFRITRLEQLKTPLHVKHLLIQSAKDVFSGFRAIF
jgi:heat shock protein HtpX